MVRLLSYQDVPAWSKIGFIKNKINFNLLISKTNKLSTVRIKEGLQEKIRSSQIIIIILFPLRDTSFKTVLLLISQRQHSSKLAWFFIFYWERQVESRWISCALIHNPILKFLTCKLGFQIRRVNWLGKELPDFGVDIWVSVFGLNNKIIMDNSDILILKIKKYYFNIFFKFFLKINHQSLSQP